MLLEMFIVAVMKAVTRLLMQANPLRQLQLRAEINSKCLPSEKELNLDKLFFLFANDVNLFKQSYVFRK